MYCAAFALIKGVAISNRDHYVTKPARE